MAAPTLQQVNLINFAAKTAYDAVAALAELQAYMTSITFSPNAAGIATADFTDPNTPGPLTGFNPQDFTNFNAAVNQIVTLVQANSGTVGKAFASMAERAPQV